jgi:type III secretion system FlhB-like substrate exporter
MDLEAESIIKIDTAKSADIALNCNKLLETQKQIKKAEEEISKLKEAEVHLSDNVIPNLMREAGISKMELTDGSVVNVKPYYQAHINESFKERAHNWLRENGHGDLIKNNVTLEFGKGQDEIAQSVIQDAQSKGYNVKQKQGVHASTLKGWVREQIQEGKQVPNDMFGVYVANRVTIKKEDK